MNRNSITDMVYVGPYARPKTITIRQDITYIAGDLLIEYNMFDDIGAGYEAPDIWVSVDKGCREEV